MILIETMNEIADAIREKTGKSEKIAPVNFAEEIKSISAGGGESGGGSSMKYYKYEGTDKNFGLGVSSFARFSFRIQVPPEVQSQVGMTEIVGFEVLPTHLYFARNEQWQSMGATITTEAFCFDPDAVVITSVTGSTPGNLEIKKMTVRDYLMLDAIDVDTFTEITEAEFYDLNA